MRRGNIDRLGDLTSLDLNALYGDKSGKLKASSYANTGFASPASYYRKIVSDFGFENLGRVVDFGGAYGRWAVFLAEVNDHVTVADTQEFLLDLGRKLAADFGFTSIDFVKDSMIASALPDASFDAAWSHSVIYLLDRDRSLSELARVLKPGGRAFLTLNGLGKVFQKICMGYERGGFDDSFFKQGRDDMMHGPLHAGPPNFATIATLDPILEPFGLRVDREFPVLDFSSGKTMDAKYALLFDDLPALAERFERDAAFRDDLVANHKRIMRCMEFDLWFAVKKVT